MVSAIEWLQSEFTFTSNATQRSRRLTTQTGHQIRRKAESTTTAERDQYAPQSLLKGVTLQPNPPTLLPSLKPIDLALWWRRPNLRRRRRI